MEQIRKHWWWMLILGLFILGSLGRALEERQEGGQEAGDGGDVVRLVAQPREPVPAYPATRTATSYLPPTAGEMGITWNLGIEVRKARAQRGLDPEQYANWSYLPDAPRYSDRRRRWLPMADVVVTTGDDRDRCEGARPKVDRKARHVFACGDVNGATYSVWYYPARWSARRARGAASALVDAFTVAGTANEAGTLQQSAAGQAEAMREGELRREAARKRLCLLRYDTLLDELPPPVTGFLVPGGACSAERTMSAQVTVNRSWHRAWPQMREAWKTQLREDYRSIGGLGIHLVDQSGRAVR